jgi:predicted CopG family antitoxin
MADENEKASNRISVTPTAHDELRDFRSGLNDSFSEAILLLLKLTRRKGEDNFSAGRRLREELEKVNQG